MLAQETALPKPAPDPCYVKIADLQQRLEFAEAAINSYYSLLAKCSDEKVGLMAQPQIDQAKQSAKPKPEAK